MAPQLFHLEGPSLEELKIQAAALYGPRALIVSAELVTVGGIRGVLARRHYEIVVEVPDPATGQADGYRSVSGSTSGSRRGRRSAAAPAGIDALLRQAELDEVRIAGGSSPAGSPAAGSRGVAAGAAAGAGGPGSGTPGAGAGEPAGVSTDSGLFAALMDNLTFATSPSAPGTVADPSAARRRHGDDAPRALPDVEPTRTEPPGGPVAAGSVTAGSTDPGPSGGSTPWGLRASGRPSAAPGSGEAPDDAPAVVPHLAPHPGDPADLPDLGGYVVDTAAAPDPVPAVLSAPGDLVIVVGAPAVVWEVAVSMAAAFGRGAPAAVAVAGPEGWLTRDARRIDDRLDANAARAAGVDGGHPVFLALSSEDPVTDARLLLALRPDQVWLAVDAGRKEADTAAWVGALRRSMERAELAPAGLAVVGSGSTATPGTVDALGLPVGWRDGGSPESPTLRRAAAVGRRRAEPAGIE